MSGWRLNYGGTLITVITVLCSQESEVLSVSFSFSISSLKSGTAMAVPAVPPVATGQCGHTSKCTLLIEKKHGQ